MNPTTAHSKNRTTVRANLVALRATRAGMRVLSPRAPGLAALWAEPDRAPYYTLPRRLLQRYRAVPGIDHEAPGPFRYADLERITRDFARAGFSLDHVEEMDVTVFEAETDAELVDWVERFYGEYYFRPKAAWRIVKKAIFNNAERRRLQKEAREYLALRAKRKKFIAEQKIAAVSGD